MSLTAKELVHHLTNQLQVVLGHLEMENYGESLTSLRKAFGVLNQLRAAILLVAPPEHKPKRKYKKRGPVLPVGGHDAPSH